MKMKNDSIDLMIEKSVPLIYTLKNREVIL